MLPLLPKAFFAQAAIAQVVFLPKYTNAQVTFHPSGIFAQVELFKQISSSFSWPFFFITIHTAKLYF